MPFSPAKTCRPPFLPRPGEGAQTWFLAAASLFFFLVIIKYGNPVILDAKIAPPTTWTEILYESWPLKWAYALFAPLFVLSLFAVRWKRLFASSATTPVKPQIHILFKTLLLLPLLWLGWQFIAATHTLSPPLTQVTLRHFTITVALFYMAYFGLSGIENPWPLWAALSLATVWVIRAGMEQHFGSLEATRRMVYENPNWRQLPVEYLRRIASDRIFSTFMYPNALAGALLFLLPLTLTFVWSLTPKLKIPIRRLLVLVLAGCGLACLYWSGSKGGWLIALVLLLVAILHSTIPSKTKLWLLSAIVLIGLAGFGVRHAKFFERGATSVVARFDYWHAALQIAKEHPVFGIGPGSFSVGYWKIKKPNAEMAQLCHNDYLEQASDSGAIGFLLFLAMICGNLILLYRCSLAFAAENIKMGLSIWLGLLGLFLQTFEEFHLYYPAFAWTAFFAMGWMFGQATDLTKNGRPEDRFP